MHAIWTNNEVLSKILYNLNISQVAKISVVSKDFYNSDPAQVISKHDDDLCHQQINWINNCTNKNILSKKCAKIYSKTMRGSLLSTLKFNAFDAKVVGWRDKTICRFFYKK